jgi:hypothetical protein
VEDLATTAAILHFQAQILVQVAAVPEQLGKIRQAAFPETVVTESHPI